MKSHNDYLKETNWLSDENRRSDIPDHSSYSIMHSFDEGFNIVMYSCTQNTIHRRGTIYRNQPAHIIAGKGQNAIWLECMLHSGAKSRFSNEDAPQSRLTNENLLNTELTEKKVSELDPPIICMPTDVVKEYLRFLRTCENLLAHAEINVKKSGGKYNRYLQEATFAMYILHYTYQHVWSLQWPWQVFVGLK